MNDEKLAAVLEAHGKWLRYEKGGVRADLSGAKLCNASLYNADLRGADLRDADLSDSNLRGANLRDAKMSRANMRGANLRGANLRAADLCRVNLRDADLREVNLRASNLRASNLRDANLRGADLRDADLRDANLRGADLSEATWDHTTVGIHAAPQGELRVWGRKAGKIVEMIVPADARRSCSTTRKMRAEYVDVISVDGDTTGNVEVFVRNAHGTTIYRAGERVHCHEWCDDRWQECAGGIHFFLTREEAESWQ